jgi:hypothetical protein
MGCHVLYYDRGSTAWDADGGLRNKLGADGGGGGGVRK